MHKPFELLFVNLVFTDDCLRTALVAGKLRIGNGLLTGWGGYMLARLLAFRDGLIVIQAIRLLILRVRLFTVGFGLS